MRLIEFGMQIFLGLFLASIINFMDRRIRIINPSIFFKIAYILIAIFYLWISGFGLIAYIKGLGVSNALNYFIQNR